MQKPGVIGLVVLALFLLLRYSYRNSADLALRGEWISRSDTQTVKMILRKNTSFLYTGFSNNGSDTTKYEGIWGIRTGMKGVSAGGNGVYLWLISYHNDTLIWHYVIANKDGMLQLRRPGASEPDLLFTRPGD